MKARILFVLPNLSAGGAERSILGLARHLTPEFEVHLALIRHTGGLVEEIPTDVRLHDLHGRLQFPFRLVALARRLSPCTVFSTIADVNLFTLALKNFLPRGTPVIIRDAVMPLDLFRHRLIKQLFSFVYRKAYRNADAVVSLTERCRRETTEKLGVSEAKVFLIHNAVSDDRMIAASDRISEQRYGRLELVSIGRLEWQKGYDLLIRSLPKILQAYPDMHLTIIGDGRERRALERDVRRLGLDEAVTLPGHVPDPIRILQQADLFVLCSRFEGMSNTMLEALYCGTPVVAVNNPENSANEFIIDGMNGFLVPGSTPETLASGVLRAIGGCRSLDRNWIRDDARSRYSYDGFLLSYRDLMKGISMRNG